MQEWEPKSFQTVAFMLGSFQTTKKMELANTWMLQARNILVNGKWEIGTERGLKSSPFGWYVSFVIYLEPKSNRPADVGSVAGFGHHLDGV